MSAIETFQASGGGALLLMDVNNGDIISLVLYQILILIRANKFFRSIKK